MVQVGDRVRVIEGTGHACQLGDICTVDRLDNEYIYVTDPDGREDCFNNRNYEPVIEGEVRMNKAQVGDEIRIIGDKSGHGREIGNTYIARSFNADGIVIDDGWGVMEEDYELADTEGETRATRSPSGARVGEKVRVLIPWGDISVGEICTVIEPNDVYWILTRDSNGDSCSCHHNKCEFAGGGAEIGDRIRIIGGGSNSDGVGYHFLELGSEWRVSGLHRDVGVRLIDCDKVVSHRDYEVVRDGDRRITIGTGGSPMNYLLVGVTAEQKEKLKSNEFSFTDFEDGILIEAKYVDKATKLVGITATHTEPTVYDGITRLFFEGEREEVVQDGKFKVSKETLGYGEKLKVYHEAPFYKSIMEHIIPVVERDVMISVPHGCMTEIPKDSSKFHIFLWSTVGRSGRDVRDVSNTPETMCGVSVSCRDTFTRKTSGGFEIIDDATGWVIGELFENALYIHHDITHQRRKAECTLFDAICKKAAEEFLLGVYSGDEEAKKKRMEARGLEIEKLRKQRYVKLCGGRRQRKIKELKDRIDNRQGHVKDYQKSLTSFMREINEKRLMLIGLENQKEGSDVYMSEYEKLISMPKIVSVDVSGDIVKIHTNNLYCENDGKTYDIGAFIIEVDTARSSVGWFNQTRVIRRGGDGNNMQAPHVGEDGRACYGNTGEIWPQLIANYEFSALAMVAIQFVESVNDTDDWGQYIVDYPLKKEVTKDSEEQASEK